MSDPEPIEKIMKKIKKKWDKDPENWNVLGNIDKDGNKEMMISQQPYNYWLKLRKITSKSNLAFGKEIKNIDNEISKNLKPQSKSINSKNELVQLFGMMVPDKNKKDLLYMSGIERVSSKLIKNQKTKIEEKEKDADKLYRLYLRKKWQREQELRDNMYL